MNKRTKTVLATGSLALVLAGTGAGVAAAQTTPSPTPPGATSSAPAPAATPGKHSHHNGGMGRVEHGEFTVHTKTGDKVVDTQRGVVTAVDAGSVTVKSTDGFTATYALDPSTKVHKGKQTATTTQIATNDVVRVLANKTGTTDTATRIGDAGPTK